MFMASRMGTPAASSVPSVRENRAMLVFATICPMIGTYRIDESSRYFPPFDFDISLKKM